MNPFDLPGPQFLGLFIGGGFVALFVAIAVKYLLAGPATARVEHLGRPRSDQLAYLVGGLERAVETAVAGLNHHGAVVITDGVVKAVNREPQLSADGVYRGIVDHGDLSDLERFVLDDVRRGETTVAALLERAEAFEPALREQLIADGMLVADPKALQLKAMLPAVLWCAVGLIKVNVGASRGKPVGFLVVLVLALFAAAYAVTRTSRRTRRGDHVVADAKARYAALETTASSAPLQLSGRDMSLAYAVFGTLILAPALAAFMPSYQRALIGSTSGVSGCGSSCGSSCGGGCGGGCGGCS